MANILTNLIPDAYAAANVVSRELSGASASVTRNTSADQAAKGEAVRIPIVQSATAHDIAPAMNAPEPNAQTVDSVELRINNHRAVSFPYNGEEVAGLNRGPGFSTIYGDQIAEAMRTLVNEVEANVFSQIVKGASRAYGTAGTTPFGSSLQDLAEAGKILTDNGAPTQSRSLVATTTAGSNLRSLENLRNVDQAGDANTLRAGVLGMIYGNMIRETGQSYFHDSVAGTGYSVNNAGGYDVGATEITVDGGVAEIKAGDVISFAGGSDKYVVAEGRTGPGSFKIAKPGLRVAIPDDASLAFAGDHTSSVLLARSAGILACRVPFLPNGSGNEKMFGASGVIEDSEVVMDPMSMLPFQIAVVGGYRQQSIEVATAWGFSVIKPEHSALLLG